MKCPKCNIPLERVRYAETSVQECANCKGHLVEGRRTEKIEKRVDKDIAELELEVAESDENDLADQVRCPRCRDRMRKKELGRLEFCVDECENCDFVWFDGGELAKVQLAFEAKPQRQEVNKMRQRLEEMTDEERQAYEERIAKLVDLGSPMGQAIRGATVALSHQYYWRGLF